ncbi:MAG: alpha/beta hydrolase [Myxococcales bacterium]
MLLRVARIVAAVFVGYLLLVFVLQRSVIYPGRRQGAAPPAPTTPPGFERVWLDPGGMRVEALYLPPPAGSDRPTAALLFAHGNAEVIDDWPPMLRLASRLGVATMVVEYPGYGRSEGEPSEESIASAMASAFDWLAARPAVDAQHIVAYGRSLGGGAAATLVGRRPLAALVLQSTFTGVARMAAARLIPPFVVRDHFDNLGAVQRFDGPVLVMHGDHDGLIPPAHGQRLAGAARDGRVVRYDCGHNDCPPDAERWLEDLREFMRDRGVL